jgi:4-carboxymuconolactone decarboxylase
MKEGGVMEDLHEIFTVFKNNYPDIYQGHEALGKAIHESGPLPPRMRRLIKVAMSGASRHNRALETHISAAREAGATEDEIKHTLLLLIQTVGFPTFMEAYSVYEKKL